jgi:hypothetical protein
MRRLLNRACAAYAAEVTQAVIILLVLGTVAMFVGYIDAHRPELPAQLEAYR